MLRLPKLFSDGCVLQKGDHCRIWGWTDPRGEVRLSLEQPGEPRQAALSSAQARADADGRFEAELSTPCAGGPYLLRVCVSGGEELIVREAYVGEVYVCAGQSNMELPMERVCERFPEEFRDGAPNVHEYKVTECRAFDGPLSDHVQAEWRRCVGEKLPEVSAFAYFFGKALVKAQNVPVGILNLSLGGTPAEAWMSREGLRAWPEALEDADRCRDEAFCKELSGREMRAEVDWQREIIRQERESADAPWRPAELPGQVRDWGLEKFCGCLHLRKSFSVPQDCLGKDALLRLGTLVDSDRIFINGKRVGETGYRYPPRRYPVRAGLLREGENEILIRLVCRDGEGRSTAGQPLELVWEDAPADMPLTSDTESLTRLALADRARRLRRVSLAGAWEYQLRAVCEEAPGQTFLSWKPTGLFHGMLAPCFPYRVRGVIWYQGESNDSRPQTYRAVLEGLIRDWRSHWRQEKLPFVIVQLPNCDVDVAPGDAWPLVREAQAQAGQMEEVAVTVNLDAGEDNDLHPRDKKTVAERAARAVRAMIGKEKLQWEAPKVCGWETEEGCVRLHFDGPVTLRLCPGDPAAAGDLRPQGPVAAENLCLEDSVAVGNLRPGDRAVAGNPRLFELAGGDGVYYPAKACIEETEDGSPAGTCVRLYSDQVSDPRYVRYAWSRAPGALLLYGGNGFCVGPFRFDIEKDAAR